MNKTKYGQYFTSNLELQEDVLKLVKLSKSNGVCLEPSCGAGHLVKMLETTGYTNILLLRKIVQLNQSATHQFYINLFLMIYLLQNLI